MPRLTTLLEDAPRIGSSYRRAEELFGRWYPERETYPGNEDWGTYGWSYLASDLAGAQKRFDSLLPKWASDVRASAILFVLTPRLRGIRAKGDSADTSKSISGMIQTGNFATSYTLLSFSLGACHLDEVFGSRASHQLSEAAFYEA